LENKNKYLRYNSSNYDKQPFVQVATEPDVAVSSWEVINNILKRKISERKQKSTIVAVEYYPGVHEEELKQQLIESLEPTISFFTNDLFKSENEVLELTRPNVTDDAVFGYMTRLKILDFFDQEKLKDAYEELSKARGLIVVYGYGATILAKEPDLLIYADMPRWELQLRYRREEINNLGISNKGEKASLQYKRGFFVDWRVADRHKKDLLRKLDFILDTTQVLAPNLIDGDSYRKALIQTVKQPFRVVPYFDSGPWGGQWMKEICDLDREKINYAWCFDCVPEENSLNLKFGNVLIETPAMNLLLYQAKPLLGDLVQARFGDEFPIRFDFLDTMEGGNLSLQVHPTTEYIRENFGMPYTQDESYYILDAGKDATVYLGLNETVDPVIMVSELKIAQEKSVPFNAAKHVTKWSVKKHDHVLIPAGTVHCSGANCMILEISATPYIFTFKLYDWERLGLDGQPRPINIDRGEKVIDWSRKENWTQQQLINRIEKVGEGKGFIEEKTGLHEQEFIETRRFWFSETIIQGTENSVNVLNLIEGREAIVESPEDVFEPFVIHYAETFIVPAAVKNYSIRPYGESVGETIGIIKAFVKH